MTNDTLDDLKTIKVSRSDPERKKFIGDDAISFQPEGYYEIPFKVSEDSNDLAAIEEANKSGPASDYNEFREELGLD